MLNVMSHKRRSGNAEARAERTRRGFTLVEMLAALLVISLMTGIVATGVTVATRVYKQEQFASQSQVLLDTIENALSDPLRFAYTDSASHKPAVTYRNNQIDAKFLNPGLQSRATSGSTSQQTLYFTGDNNATGVALLNEGVYGDCSVNVDSFEMTNYPEETSDAYQTSISLTVTSKSDPSLTLQRSFIFTSNAGVSKIDSFATPLPSGGGVSGETKHDRKGTTVTDRLYGGTGTAEESGFAIYDTGLVAADKTALGAAVRDAWAMLERESSLDADSVATLRSALYDALVTMFTFNATQAQVDDAHTRLRDALGAFGEIYTPEPTRVVVTLSEGPAASSWQYGTDQTGVYARATVYDQKDNEMPEATVTWISENTSVVEVDPSTGLLTFKGTGGTNVKAEAAQWVTGSTYVQVLAQSSSGGGEKLPVGPPAIGAVTDAQKALSDQFQWNQSQFAWDYYGDNLIVAVAHNWGDAVAVVWDGKNYYKLRQNNNDACQNLTHDDAFTLSDLTDGETHKYNYQYGYSWVKVDI